MATLGELQEQLAALKERYSAVIEGTYSYEADIATIAVNMQAQLDDAQAAASSAGTYAAIAENAADEAAAAGAEAGATAGATAGASAAQTKYDAIFTQEHTWQGKQTINNRLDVAYSIAANNLIVNDGVQAQDVNVYSQVKANVFVVGQRVAHPILATVGAGVDNLIELKIDSQDANYSAVLTCYSAALNCCSVATTLSVGQLTMNDITLNYSELAQLKALINQ